MSREIKFRAWTGKELLYITPDADLQLNIGINDGWSLWEPYGELCDHKKGELMQYTGLKDKIGKEIFEGDILKVPDWYDLPENTSMTFNNQVVGHENCSFTLKGYPIHDNHEYITEECEIIGNIYENPEMLEGGQA